MSKSGIQINVSGGNAVVGNISQGDNNQLDTHQSNNIAATDLEQFYTAIEVLAGESSKVSTADYLALKAEVESLTKQSTNTDIVDCLKSLYKKYTWAATPLKTLLGVLVA
jgi:uncharacterized sporulation protein YeaH/YhbH (DUF444 family)